jgi:hypothetical protein
MRANMQVSSTDLPIAQGFHALIGRDILVHCVMTYNDTMQQLTIAFCCMG